ncbi:MAG: hypothetical protein KGJ68_07420 [Gammaproteobacteria bacterium]|nr:hypothetical protein [Gammaproteobacteria bacterium]
MVRFTKAPVLSGVLAALACAGGISAADEKASAPPHTPSAWGLLTAHKACVIFREYRKTKVGFFVLIITAKTHSELEVIETTDGYVMDPKTYVEDEATMDVLQHRAIRDGLRYVKVADKYTPAELEAARALCRQEEITE